MNKVISNLVFYSGQINKEENEAKKNNQIKQDETKLAYTDKNFAIRDLAFSSLLDDTFLQSKI